MKPKYLRVVSDLHLEGFTWSDPQYVIDKFLPHDDRDGQSILALAGDISSRPDQLLAFLTEIEMRFLRVFVIPGNHEYYRHDFDQLNLVFDRIGDKLYKTMHSSGNVVVAELDDYTLIMGTLWADGGASYQEEYAVAYYLNDFRLISKENATRRFTVPDMKTINAIHKNQIENALRQTKKKAIVITHHIPSYQLCHPRFGTDCNGGFASHCDKLMHEDWSPVIWIHGHTHDTGDSIIGNTRIVCNPAGYRGEWESPFNQFGPKFIEL